MLAASANPSAASRSAWPRVGRRKERHPIAASISPASTLLIHSVPAGPKAENKFTASADPDVPDTATPAISSGAARRSRREPAPAAPWSPPRKTGLPVRRIVAGSVIGLSLPVTCAANVTARLAR